jgi:hypothetical protein
MRAVILLVLVVLLSTTFPVTMPAQQQQTPTLPRGEILLTIFLRHDESKTLDQINRHLEQTGFAKNFPPQGVEVVSWYVMMGIGQVVTLRFPAERLREVNLAIEHGAWGAFRTEFYATYDYKSIAESERKSARSG